MSKIKKNIYRPDVEVNFKLYGHVDFKAPKSFEIYWVGQYLVNFTGLACIVNATVNKTEPIFTSIRHGKLSLIFNTDPLEIYTFDTKATFPMGHWVNKMINHGWKGITPKTLKLFTNRQRHRASCLFTGVLFAYSMLLGLHMWSFVHDITVN